MTSLQGDEEVPEGIMVHFDKTLPMSTYLLYFIVSDFKYTGKTFDNNGTNIPFTIYSNSDQLAETNYASTLGKSVIEYYVKYVNIPYPLPKMGE